MGRIRDAIAKRVLRVLDAIDPPKQKAPRAPCPACGGDVSDHHTKSAVRDELVFFQCSQCGHASAWYWNGHGPKLIYGQEPRTNPEMDEDLD